MPKERGGRLAPAVEWDPSHWLDFFCISLILQTVFPCFQKLYSTMLREGRAEKAGTSCRMGSQSVRGGSLTGADVATKDPDQLILRENTKLCASKTIIAGLC